MIGFLRIDDESGLRTYPVSRRAAEEWKDPVPCESTGAARYDIYKISSHENCV